MTFAHTSEPVEQRSGEMIISSTPLSTVFVELDPLVNPDLVQSMNRHLWRPLVAGHPVGHVADMTTMSLR